MDESRINNRFFEWSRNCPGINYKVVDGKLFIVVDVETVSNSGTVFSAKEGYPDFIIGNGNFWIEEKHKFEKCTEYKVSNIRFSGPEHTMEDIKSKQVSKIFPEVSYSETITVILK
jgi:hypothetical protein